MGVREAQVTPSFRGFAKTYGGKTIATVITAKHAQAAERDGADALDE